MYKLLKNISFGDLYKRLEEESPHTKIIDTNETFSNLLEELHGKDWVLGIGGGGAFGVASFEVLKTLKEKGVIPKKIVGNSIGSILAVLFALDEITDENLEYFLNAKNILESISREYLACKILPFAIKMEKHQRKEIIENFEKFRNLIKQNTEYKQYISNNNTKGIEIILQEFLKVPNQKFKKITFLDLQQESGIQIGIHITAITPIFSYLKSKLPLIPTKTLLRKIILRGNFPVMDAIMASASPGRIEKLNAKNLDAYTTDGYFTGNYPNAYKDFNSTDPETPIVLIQTDDNWWLTRGVVGSYNDISYVIRPDLREGVANNLSQKNINRIRHIAQEIIKQT